MTRILVTLLAALFIFSTSSAEENMFYIGFGYPVVAEDDATDFSAFEDQEDYESLSIPLAFELAYYIGITDQLGVGPVISNRLNVSTYDYSNSFGGVEVSATGGVLASHSLIGASGTYYILDDFGKGLFGRADLGVGLANYFSLDSDDADDIDPDNPDLGDVADSYSGVGLGLNLGVGYSLPMGSSSAFDIQLLYSMFPITVEEDIEVLGTTTTRTITDGASYLTLLIGFKL